MMRLLTCFLVAASCTTAAPDATPPPPPRGHALQIHIGCCSCIEIDDIWRDDYLPAVLERETVSDWLDHINAASEDGELEELDLDPHLTAHAEGITALPPIGEDLPLQ